LPTEYWPGERFEWLVCDADGYRVVNAMSLPGHQVVVQSRPTLKARKTALVFTLNYDQTKLSNPLVSVGSGVPVGSTLIPNTLQTGKAVS